MSYRSVLSIVYKLICVVIKYCQFGFNFMKLDVVLLFFVFLSISQNKTLFYKYILYLKYI